MIVYGWYCSLKLELAWLERQCGCGWWFSVRFYWWCIGCVTNRERKRFVYSIHSWFPFFCSLLIQWVLVVMSTDIAVYLRPANQTIVSGSTSFTAQSEAALSLPEGVWVAGVLVIIALILLRFSWSPRKRRFVDMEYPPYAWSNANRIRTSRRRLWFVEEMKLRTFLQILRWDLAPFSISMLIHKKGPMEVNSPFTPLHLW